MTDTIDKPITSTEAQRGLDELQAEQAGLNEARTAARRAGDTGEAMRLEQRAEDLPAEIEQARVTLLRAQLTERWVEAEHAAQLAQEARTAYDDASAASQRFRQDFRVQNRTAAEFGAIQAEHGQLMTNLEQAKTTWTELHYAALLALSEVDDLEAAIEEATGEQPEAGQGLRAVRVLAGNFTLYDPRHGTEAQQLHNQERPITFTAGSTPPRWAAWELADNLYAWETA